MHVEVPAKILVERAHTRNANYALGPIVLNLYTRDILPYLGQRFVSTDIVNLHIIRVYHLHAYNSNSSALVFTP